MSFTYGYDLKDGDKLLETSIQVSEKLSPLIIPGGSLVNDLPFCTISNFILAIRVASHSYFQCGTFLHGSHSSATNHSPKQSESLLRGSRMNPSILSRMLWC